MTIAAWFIVAGLFVIGLYEIIAVWHKDDDIKTITQATRVWLREVPIWQGFVLMFIGGLLWHLFGIG